MRLQKRTIKFNLPFHKYWNYIFGSIFTSISIYTFTIFSITEQLISMLLLLIGLFTLTIHNEE